MSAQATHATSPAAAAEALAANIAKAMSYLKRFREQPLGHFIAGKARARFQQGAVRQCVARRLARHQSGCGGR